MTSSHGRLVAARTFLRAWSQAAAFVIGLVLAVVGTLLWYYQRINPIMGSLLVGIGASIIAAAIVAYLSPVNESAFRKFISLGIDEVWSSRQAIDQRHWVDWVSKASDNCTLLGVANGNWFTDQRFFPTVKDRLGHGVVFKILFLDPNSAAAELRAREERGKRKKDTRDAIRESIQAVWAFRESLLPGLKDRLRMFVYDATPSCGLTWVDNFMIVTHYLPGLPNVTSPALLVKLPQVGIERSLFEIYVENVKEIEMRSTELDERNVQRYVPRGDQTRNGVNSSGVQAVPVQQESAEKDT